MRASHPPTQLHVQEMGALGPRVQLMTWWRQKPSASSWGCQGGEGLSSVSQVFHSLPSDFTHANQVQSPGQERGDGVEGTKPRYLDGVNISYHPPSRPGSLLRRSHHLMAMTSRERASHPHPWGASLALGSFTRICSNLLRTENKGFALFRL